jgi:Ran GTPase-activating protein (RanGAP) involved in mRNA processing and transport
MEKRGLKSTGFPDTDKEILQRAFNEEFAAELDELRAKQRERRRRAAQQAGLQKRRMMMEETLQEEQDELARSHQVAMMIDLVKDDSMESNARIDVNSVSARSLAKALWVNTSITCLDLSANALDDHAGQYLARALTRNKTLKKMELDNNLMGSRTLHAFGESLKVNTTLVYLSLDSNPLFTYDDSKGAKQFFDAFKTNKTLTALNLWRTGMKVHDGDLLAQALHLNRTLLILDIGHNGVKMKEMKKIADKIDRNLADFEVAERMRREEALTEDQKMQKIRDAEEVSKREQNPATPHIHSHYPSQL